MSNNFIVGFGEVWDGVFYKKLSAYPKILTKSKG